MVTDFSAAEKVSGVKLCMLLRLLSGMNVSHFGGQRSKVKVTRDKNAISDANTHPCEYEWYALAARCKQRAAAADGRISWLARGDFGGLRALARLNGQSESGVAASRKAVWWDLRLASLLTHLLDFR